MKSKFSQYVGLEREADSYANDLKYKYCRTIFGLLAMKFQKTQCSN